MMVIDFEDSLLRFCCSLRSAGTRFAEGLVTCVSNVPRELEVRRLGRFHESSPSSCCIVLIILYAICDNIVK